MKYGGSIVGVGIDIVEVNDITKARYQKRVAEYFLTEDELQNLPAEAAWPQHLASRFALKEAVIKAFPEKLSPFDFAVTKEGKRPTISFADKERNAKYSVAVSLTHTAHTAAALAVVSLT